MHLYSKCNILNKMVCNNFVNNFNIFTPLFFFYTIKMEKGIGGLVHTTTWPNPTQPKKRMWDSPRTIDLNLRFVALCCVEKLRSISLDITPKIQGGFLLHLFLTLTLSLSLFLTHITSLPRSHGLRFLLLLLFPVSFVFFFLSQLHINFDVTLFFMLSFHSIVSFHSLCDCYLC